MAQLAQDRNLDGWIDDYLDFLLREWSGIPALAAEWDGWDEHSKLVFDLDWGVPEDRLFQLRRWSDRGLLTTEQRARYDELLKLIAEYRPLLERLLAE